ncbi:hypothetical protein UFOVP242_200 [uncultured Caudovirales phage]|uniref:Uncharacterized protein n=1 Tax=uncultured Caudovirales phage TaxID=2100421 RepID=A0A6J7WVH6_9CAUD|nr:hypothetical protein UFOVP242_200 [uncultured Caudovirales phage]
MPDFEALPTGTQKELLLSRDLFMAIEQLTKQYGEGIIPHQLSISYNTLKEHYDSSHKRSDS